MNGRQDDDDLFYDVYDCDFNSNKMKNDDYFDVTNAVKRERKRERSSRKGR
jgi:hypothetical protein